MAAAGFRQNSCLWRLNRQFTAHTKMERRYLPPVGQLMTGAGGLLHMGPVRDLHGGSHASFDETDASEAAACTNEIVHRLHGLGLGAGTPGFR